MIIPTVCFVPVFERGHGRKKDVCDGPEPSHATIAAFVTNVLIRFVTV